MKRTTEGVRGLDIKYFQQIGHGQLIIGLVGPGNIARRSRKLLWWSLSESNLVLHRYIIDLGNNLGLCLPGTGARARGLA